MSFPNFSYGTGRRKRSSARVFIKPNRSEQASITINDKPIAHYFTEFSTLHNLRKPLTILHLENMFDINIRVHGGGKSGQSDAIRLGLAKALIAFEKTNDVTLDTIKNQSNTEEVTHTSFYQTLRQHNLTTTNARKVERKKYGLHKARKKATYRKR